MKATILLAEDERDMREVLCDYFTAKSGGISAAVPKLLAAAVVFITYKWKHQTLVSILLGTISYMMLLRLF